MSILRRINGLAARISVLLLSSFWITARCDAGNQPAPSSAEFPTHYTDTAHGFSLDLPSVVSKGNPSDELPAGTITFIKFPVPKGTTLDEKHLSLIPGANPNMQAADKAGMVTKTGTLTASGVKFTRYEWSEGSAGNWTKDIIYRWSRAKAEFDFDFSFREADPGGYLPAVVPRYDQDAQLKYTERLMKTFRRLPH